MTGPRPVLERRQWRRALPRVALSSVLGLTALACQDQNQQDIPNRVLDRPTDVALVCVDQECTTDADGNELCETVPLPLNVCATETGSCSSDNPHLVGFVANSERNEIAMFSKCSNRLVDMNVDVPGYNFIPAGVLPTELDASADGCRVFSANVGSCDLSVLDAPKLASFGLGSAESRGKTDEVDEPSSLVSTLIPRTFDVDLGGFRPLGARPGQILSVPAALTQAPDLGLGLSGLCDPKIARSVYVTFPSCNLVAEVDVLTGNVLQSRQFVSDGLGGVSVEDTGVSPLCPVECPVQFEGGLPAQNPSLDPDGPFIQALELSLEPTPPTSENDPNQADPSAQSFDDADEAVEGQRLYVGGLGSDRLFEIPITDAGEWEVSANQLELSDAGGVKQIRVSPAVNASVQDSPYSQFIYVIAGDGSTRVIGRPLPAPVDSIGIECETQLDPSVLEPGIEVSACVPVNQGPNDGQPATRRGFSRGPGIRPGRGEEVTDWMFRKTYPGALGTGPFSEPGTVAVGVTTGGFAIYTMINQQRASGATTVDQLLGRSADPADIMDVRLFPHSQWPEPGEPAAELPLMQDDPPGRFIPSDSGPTRQLAPTLRRIDATYSEDERAAAQLNVTADLDRLGNGLFYDEDVVRAVVRDYRSWGDSGGPNWTLEWEGTIPGTPSTTGRIDCDKPGQDGYGGTCLVDADNEAKLIDSGANFCDDGVLPGDKLVIVGCRDDDDCGDGRRCLRESVAAAESTGICVSGQDYADRAAELRQICADFISDPCGEAYREFTVTRATQDTLWIQSMDQPLMSRVAETPCEGQLNAVQVGAEGECACLPGFSTGACGPGAEPGCCPDPNTILSGQAPVLEVEDRYVCTNWPPDPGCEEDAECKCDPMSDEGCDPLDADGICIENRCRRVCEDADDCIFRRLPGPTCFGEFVRYQVGLRNSFRVSGPGLDFISDLVEVGPDGECRETTNTELSRLLTSRLPLPATDLPDDPDWLAIPTCVGDGVTPSNANPCRVVAPRSTANTFHQFEYEGRATVSALRYSNPIFSIILDLTSLESLTSEVPGYDDSVWPLDLVGFRRSRIPRLYRQSFGVETGYAPFADFLTLEGRPVTYPIRIVQAPQSTVAYIVDGSGPGSSSSIRGQVVRVFLGEQVQADESFTGVR